MYYRKVLPAHDFRQLYRFQQLYPADYASLPALHQRDHQLHDAVAQRRLSVSRKRAEASRCRGVQRAAQDQLRCWQPPSLHDVQVGQRETRNARLLYGPLETSLVSYVWTFKVMIESVRNYAFTFSYELVSDESEHTVELLSERQNFTLRVDGGVARSMVNAGDLEYLEVDTPLFLGGVPPDVARHAQAQWHLRNSTSFQGVKLYRICVLQIKLRLKGIFMSWHLKGICEIGYDF